MPYKSILYFYFQILLSSIFLLTSIEKDIKVSKTVNQKTNDILVNETFKVFINVNELSSYENERI